MRLKEETPEKFEEVAKGRTTAKKDGTTERTAKPSSTSFKPGDTIYEIEDYHPDVACSPRTLDAAKEERKNRIATLINDLQKTLKMAPAIVTRT